MIREHRRRRWKVSQSLHVLRDISSGILNRTRALKHALLIEEKELRWLAVIIEGEKAFGLDISDTVGPEVQLRHNHAEQLCHRAARPSCVLNSVHFIAVESDDLVSERSSRDVRD